MVKNQKTLKQTTRSVGFVNFKQEVTCALYGPKKFYKILYFIFFRILFRKIDSSNLNTFINTDNLFMNNINFIK